MSKHRMTRRGRRGNDRQSSPGSSQPAGSRAARHRQPRWRSLAMLALRVGLLGFFAGAISLFALVQAMPVPAAPVPVASTVYGRSDEIVARLYIEDRTPISIDELPKHLLQAIVAVEDYRYYQHAGVDPLGIVRSAYRNLQARRIVEGASTITQQLARELYLTQTRTWTRKVQEAIIALKLEQRHSKREILEMYLNQVYFGHGAFGVEVASRIYFGKSAGEVTLAEGALLAGLLRSPENYSPYRDPGVALRRRAFVLSRMVDLGILSEAEAETARAEELDLAGLTPRVAEAPYFVDYVLGQISRNHPDVASGVYQGGYQIYTTLDMQMQRAANEAMRTQLTQGEQNAKGVTQPQAALVAVDPQTGGVLAMVGGRSYRETQLNRASQAHRQPGSAFKPFLYAALIDNNYTTISQMMDEPVSYPAGPGQPLYTPVNYGQTPYSYTNLTMREALKISGNVVAVRWAYELSPATVITYARRMGITSPLSPFLPLVLGSFEIYPLEIAAGYAPLANGGFRVEPHAVRRVVAPDGVVIYEEEPRITPAISASTAYLVTDMLKAVMGPGGTGGHLGWRLGRPSAGKTGTTDESKDAWFVGYVPQVVCAVYVGYDEPRTLWGPGGRLAGPIWAEFMRLGLQGVPVTDFPRPPDVVSVTLCEETLLVANPTCPTLVEVFREGTQPQSLCPLWHGDFPPWPPGPGNGDEPGPSEEPGVPGDDDDDDDDDEINQAVWRRWIEATLEAWRREGANWPDGP